MAWDIRAFPSGLCRVGRRDILISTFRTAANSNMEINATVPFETTLLVRDTCLCLHVQRAARALARRFDDALRGLGLTSGQFSLLMSLNRPRTPSMAAVAALLAMLQTCAPGLVVVNIDNGIGAGVAAARIANQSAAAQSRRASLGAGGAPAARGE